MCYFLYLASPLTLSEVRSMLPPGLTADLAPSHRSALTRLVPKAQTVAQLRVGSCSCDLFRTRQANPIEDERELRSRYSRLKIPRAEVIKALERHRRGPVSRPVPSTGWADAIAAFVVEHARNAGPALYLLEFSHVQADATAGPATPVARSVSEVRQQRDRWLIEGSPTIVG
ncbi:MAG TPA: hypothetical protein VGP44_00950 [Gemmatimonadales bacterium]|nr:hypothetical protein [Gemmatimonadales bacterium]